MFSMRPEEGPCGGRAVAVYDGMSAQAAYFSAMYRHRPVLSEKLKEMARIFSAGQKSHRGSIGSCVKVENVGILRNVRIGDSIGSFVKVENVGILRNVRVGDNAVVQGCLRLFDGTVASTAEAPTLMGCGIVCTDFIVQSGAVVEDGAQISRTFVGHRGLSCPVDSHARTVCFLPTPIVKTERLFPCLQGRLPFHTINPH